MNSHPLSRLLLLVIDAFVAVTAIAGGTVLVLGAVVPGFTTFLTPPVEYLEGSPFSSYLVPGLALALVLGGLHAVAFVLVLRRHRWAVLGASVAGFATLVWIFVQMVYIPFSFLQALYVGAGLAELGFILLILGVFRAQELPARAA